MRGAPNSALSAYSKVTLRLTICGFAVELCRHVMAAKVWATPLRNRRRMTSALVVQGVFYRRSSLRIKTQTMHMTRRTISHDYFFNDKANCPPCSPHDSLYFPLPRPLMHKPRLPTFSPHLSPTLLLLLHLSHLPLPIQLFDLLELLFTQLSPLCPLFG